MYIYIYIYKYAHSRASVYIYIYTYLAPHCIALHYIAVHYIALHYATLHHTTLHYITSHHIASHYTALHHVTCITCNYIYIYIYIYICICKIGVYIFFQGLSKVCPDCAHVHSQAGMLPKRLHGKRNASMWIGVGIKLQKIGYNRLETTVLPLTIIQGK